MTEELRAWKTDANNAHEQTEWKQQKALKSAMKSPTHGNRGQVAQNG